MKYLVFVRTGFIGEEIAAMIAANKTSKFTLITDQGIQYTSQNNLNYPHEITVYFFDHKINPHKLTTNSIYFETYDHVYAMNTDLSDQQLTHAKITEWTSPQELLKVFNKSWGVFVDYTVEDTPAYLACQVIKCDVPLKRMKTLQYILRTHNLTKYSGKAQAYTEKAQHMVNVAVEHSIFAQNVAFVSLGSMGEINRTHVSLRARYGTEIMSIVHYYRVVDNHFINKLSVRVPIAQMTTAQNFLTQVCGNNYGGVTEDVYGVPDDTHYQAGGTCQDEIDLLTEIYQIMSPYLSI